MKLKDFTLNALKIAGVTDAELTELSAAENINDITVSDALMGKFNAGVMNLNSAKSNLDLKKHFNAQVYNGMDAEITRLVEEHDFDSLSRFDIDAEKSTPKKLALLLKAANKKFSTAKTPANADELKALNDQILKLKTDYEATIKSKDAEFENQLIGFQRSQYLATKEYANITDKEIGVKIANEYVNKALTEKGAILVRDNGQLKLKSAKDPSLDYYENNKAVSFAEFSDGVLAQNNLLKVQTQTQTQAQTGTQTTTTTGTPEINTSVIDRNKAELEKYKAATHPQQ